MRIKKPQIGDVYSIAIAPKLYAFGRYLNDGGLEIYSARASDNVLPEDLGKVEFMAGIYLPSYKDGRIILVGRLDFKTEDESWPPPSYIHNYMNDTYSIYYKGTIAPSDRKHCLGLESTAIWSLDQLIDRINGDTKWVKVLGANDEDA
jgi:hypothetical protein